MATLRKKIVFFDGCGTLWYPKLTKRKENPFWIYTVFEKERDINKQLILTPFSRRVLQILKKRGLSLCILSTSPRPPAQANLRLKKRLKYFGLGNIFDEVHATPAYHESKSEFIVKILRQRKIQKREALMVGDRYLWDYKHIVKKGILALLIESDYEIKTAILRKKKRTIKTLRDVIRFL